MPAPTPATTPAAPRAARRQRASARLASLLVCATLLLVTAFIYAQTARFPFITYDDPVYASGNPHVQAGLNAADARWAFTTTDCSNWHPLTWLSLQLDAQLFGSWAGGFHLMNALLHALNCALLFFWLRAATAPALTSARAWLPAAIAALLFAAHPLHVESVAWVTERKDTLSTFFFFLTLLAYTRYAQRADRRAYALALGCYALGLMTKPMLVTLPPLLLLLDFWPLRRWRVDYGKESRWWWFVDRRAGRLLLEKIPFAALAAASCVVTVLVQHNAEVPLDSYPLHWRVVNAVVAYGRYLQKTVWPADLVLPYPFDTQVPWLTFAWAGIALPGLTALALWQWRRRPYLLVGWGWFLLTLVPVIGMVQVGSQAMADRYSYLPHIGLFSALGLLFGNAIAQLRIRFRLAAASLQIAGCVVLAALAWQAREQCALWRSSTVLFRHTRDVYGSNHLVDGLLMRSRLAEGDVAGALPYAESALRWQPDNVADLRCVADMHSALGHWAAALPLLQQIHDIQPENADVLSRLGVAFAHTGQGDLAQAAFTRALQLRPDDVATRVSFARLEQTLGDHAAAAQEFTDALARDPGCAEALARLAWLRATSPDAAVRDAARAVELAERLRALGGGAHTLVALDCLAAAHAELGQWPAAEANAVAALERAQASGQMPPAAIAQRSERLARIRARQRVRE